MRTFKRVLVVMAMTVTLLAFTGCRTEATGAQAIRLLVDGKDITHLTEPVIENGRTLVPIRFVTEEMGGEVTWDNTTRTVTVSKDGKSLRLVIGSRAVEIGNGQDAVVSDVAPRIINDRTFVPLRLISNGLGIEVTWDNSTRTVSVNSERPASIEPFFDFGISSHRGGAVIAGTTRISVSAGAGILREGNQLRLFLLDKSDNRGFLVGSAGAEKGQVDFVPEMEQQGQKLLVAAVYDPNGVFVAGDSIPVTVNVSPQVEVGGLVENMVVSSAVQMNPRINFAPHSVKYIITNQTTGKVTVENERDPFGPFTWNPMSTDRGIHTVQMIARDHNNNEYPGRVYRVNVQVPQRLTISGVTSGTAIRGPVTLMANRNFDVRETQFIMRDPSTGVETIIQTIPYGTYTWFPGPGISGAKDMVVRVIDASGNTVTSDPVRVNVDGSPRLQIQGIGPKQVLETQAELNFRTNVDIRDPEFVLTNRTTGRSTVLKAGPDDGKAVFIPKTDDTGDWTAQARGTYNGRVLTSDLVEFKVYTRQTFGPETIVPKDQFKSFASRMAVDSYRKTGMSAAIQTAQAILETGWGQYVPRDKYSGKSSNNLFGIKGSASNGSVTSNTWEVYNGVTYRVDAQFRAYMSVQESWDDHKALLLQAERYGIFRDVMYSSTMGSWAIRRAGYATDPQYPIKLMDIIRTNNLRELDRIVF